MKAIKKIIAIAMSCVLFFTPTVCFAITYVSDSSVVSFSTPTSASQAEESWTLQLGTSYKNAPTPPIVVDDTLIVMSGKKLYKINAENGKTIKTADMADAPSYSNTPVTYADGVIYCPLNNAKIQAFDYKTMKPLWLYTDSYGGQSLTTITYNDGYIYTGFWNNEDDYGNYVCIDVKDTDKSNTSESKNAVWIYKRMGGFYWADCVIVGDFAVFGSDDGTVYDNKTSQVICVNKKTGKIVDTLSVTGDQRSGITYENGNLYFVTKAGYFYSVTLNSNGLFVDASLRRLSLGGASTSTPVIYNGRAYVGVQGDSFSTGYLKVIDISTNKIIYSVKTKGYPQSQVLVSDAYFKDTNKVYIYTSYNAALGGITVITDSVGQTSSISEELYTPPESQRNYCISRIVSDENGTLYYKNDSGTIFAVSNKQNTQSWFMKIISAIINFFKNIFN